MKWTEAGADVTSHEPPWNLNLCSLSLLHCNYGICILLSNVFALLLHHGSEANLLLPLRGQTCQSESLPWAGELVHGCTDSRKWPPSCRQEISDLQRIENFRERKAKSSSASSFSSKRISYHRTWAERGLYHHSAIKQPKLLWWGIDIKHLKKMVCTNQAQKPAGKHLLVVCNGDKNAPFVLH